MDDIASRTIEDKTLTKDLKTSATHVIPENCMYLTLEVSWKQSKSNLKSQLQYIGTKI